MTICYFGDYDRDYARTRVILRGLEAHDVSIRHCNVREKGVVGYWKLWRQLRSLHGAYDVIFIPMSNTRIYPFLAQLWSSKPVVWEPLFSLYDNWVNDRKLVSPLHPKAFYYWFLDWLGSHSADMVVLDTRTNAMFFHDTFGVSQKKLAHVYIGADDTIFSPLERTNVAPNFEVEFHGGYIPVQGADVIVRAAKLLENDGMHFTMIGSGQTLKATKRLAEELKVSNVTFLPFLPQTEVVQYIQNAAVCIGLIGDVPRVVRAIPNKLYEAAAMSRPCINADTPALRELFTPGVDTIGVKQGDPKDLVRVIRELKVSGNGSEIGKRARETYLKWGTNKEVGKQMVSVLSRLPHKRIS